MMVHMPLATPFVLDRLKKYNARASFFCIGKNVLEETAIYKRILMEGHRVGNHTYNHLNGWKTDNKIYLENIEKARRTDRFRFIPATLWTGHRISDPESD